MWSPIQFSIWSLPCQDKTPYIRNAIFSGEGIENLKKVSYCILLTSHISYLKNISYVVLLLIFWNVTVFLVKNIILFKLWAKNCFNVALLTSILPNYSVTFGIFNFLSPTLWSIAIWRCAQSILRVKLHKKGYKTKNREICIFGVLTRHGSGGGGSGSKTVLKGHGDD